MCGRNMEQFIQSVIDHALECVVVVHVALAAEGTIDYSFIPPHEIDIHTCACTILSTCNYSYW